MEAPTRKDKINMIDIDQADLINKAFDYATEAHRGQVDDDGEPAIAHPVMVANILMCLTEDHNLIAAAGLHDTIEDTNVTYEDLLKEFGEDIADLVNEVTHEGSKREGYYFPRLHTQRGIMLKFADRLHNISRMRSWPFDRQQHYLKKSKFWGSEEKTAQHSSKI